jgi:hypothetical protein
MHFIRQATSTQICRELSFNCCNWALYKRSVLLPLTVLPKYQAVKLVHSELSNQVMTSRSLKENVIAKFDLLTDMLMKILVFWDVRRVDW